MCGSVFKFMIILVILLCKSLEIYFFKEEKKEKEKKKVELVPRFQWNANKDEFSTSLLIH